MTVSETIVLNLWFLFMASIENQEITVPENVGYNYYWAEWSYGCKGLSYNVCVVVNWCEFVLVLFSIWPLEEHVLVNSFIVRYGDVLTCGYSASFGTVVHQRHTLYIKGSPDSVHDMGQAWFCMCYLTSGELIVKHQWMILCFQCCLAARSGCWCWDRLSAPLPSTWRSTAR